MQILVSLLPGALPGPATSREALVRRPSVASVRKIFPIRRVGRSFDGIDYRFLKPIRDHMPADYERILEWFLLADLDIARRQFAGVTA